MKCDNHPTREATCRSGPHVLCDECLAKVIVVHTGNYAENRDEYHRAAAAARDSATRKGQPIGTGVLAYFPKALALISEVSRKGNDKHNPGQPLHWAKEKSTDEADCAVRHIVDALAEGPLALDTEGVPNLASAAWRVLAWLERVLEGDERWRTVPRPTEPYAGPSRGGPVTLDHVRTVGVDGAVYWTRNG